MSLSATVRLKLFVPVGEKLITGKLLKFTSDATKVGLDEPVPMADSPLPDWSAQLSTVPD
jgi:hypothetical protein